jgi:hypothetical protein
VAAHAHADLVVEMKIPVTANLRAELTHISGISKAESFLDVGNDYFARLVRITVDPQKDSEVNEHLLRDLRVKKVEPITEAQLQSVEVAPNTVALGNDPLTPYQWGLENQGLATTFTGRNLRLNMNLEFRERFALLS